MHTSSTKRVDYGAACSNDKNSIFRRAVHVQSFQSPCMCTKMRVRIFCLTGEERAKQELQNAFLDESPTQNEAKIQPFKVRILFVIFARNLPIEMVYYRC